MTDWIVRRWARYGHERLYAETPVGTLLGYLDLKTGRYHSDDLTNLPLLEKALSDHLAAHSTTRHPASAVPVLHISEATPEVAVGEANVSVPSEPDWIDISSTRAGAAARERAIAERESQGRLRHVLSRFVGAKPDERAWRIGADGEAAEQLAKLGPLWRVLHAVRVGQRDSDIDHVVIGPAGVFTINAKHHRHASVWVGGDTFMVNGQRVPYIRNSRHEARRAARLLAEQTGFPVQVTGVIAVMGAQRVFTIKEQPADGSVLVVKRRRIGRHLLNLPTRLSIHEIDATFDVARRSTTWR